MEHSDVGTERTTALTEKILKLASNEPSDVGLAALITATLGFVQRLGGDEQLVESICSAIRRHWETLEKLSRDRN
jgi:hypothetical protein